MKRKSSMTAVERLEREVAALSQDDLAEFREWFLDHDWDSWDHRIEKDVAAGKLDALADKALAQHAAGRTKPL
jgi:hypothetical protein